MHVFEIIIWGYNNFHISNRCDALGYCCGQWDCLNYNQISLSTSSHFAVCSRLTVAYILTQTWNKCHFTPKSGWHHQMEAFSASMAFCAGNSPVTGEFPSQRPVTRSFDAFYDLRRNKRLNKQSWGWWFETPSRLSWRQCNATTYWVSNSSCCLIPNKSCFCFVL